MIQAARAALLLLILLAGHTPAQAEAPRLVVGTMRMPPFALRSDDGAWSGLSIELWQRIAAELGVASDYKEFDYDPDGLLDAVERGGVDVAIAAIPVTPEGEARFDFSHPYFAAGLGIAVRVLPDGGGFGALRALFTLQLLGAVAGLACVLLTVGSLVWLSERRRNPGHFDPRPVQGVGDGVWWAAVTMTTTGYGDKTPITARGRAIGLVWMFASIFCIALFSATLASSFVVNKLRTTVSGPNDLQSARVGVVTGTAGEQWLRLQGLSGRTFPFVIQASKALQRGEIDAIVFERAILGHMIKEYAWTDLQVLPQTLAVRDFGLALPTNSARKEDINRALLTVTQRPEWREIVKSYVGMTEP